jgi:hypothetical protein
VSSQLAVGSDKHMIGRCSCFHPPEHTHDALGLQVLLVERSTAWAGPATTTGCEQPQRQVAAWPGSRALLPAAVSTGRRASSAFEIPGCYKQRNLQLVFANKTITAPGNYHRCGWGLLQGNRVTMKPQVEVGTCRSMQSPYTHMLSC